VLRWLMADSEGRFLPSLSLKVPFEKDLVFCEKLDLPSTSVCSNWAALTSSDADNSLGAPIRAVEIPFFLKRVFRDFAW
jgi:hypothetical protein